VADRVRVARIGAAHGIRGEVKLWSFTEDPMTVGSYGPLETEDGTRRFKIDTMRPGKNFLVAQLAGVTDRNAAEALCNLDLFVPRERLPPIEDDDTFYHADLVGLSVVSEDGNTIGTLSAIHNFGAGDLFEIKPADGGETLMVPFTDATVPKIDLDAKRIVVVPPTETEAKEED
jgi:16S rRNA processing protein RimM